MQSIEAINIVADRIMFFHLGYGLFATRQFEKGDFLLEYVGERITPKMAADRDRKYAKEDSKAYPRCYIFNYKFNGKEHW